MTHQNYVKSPSSPMIVIQRHGLWDTTDKCIMYLKELLDVMKTGFAGMSEAMRGEFSETKEEMQSGFGNLDSKMDMMIEKQDETTANSGRSRANST